MARCSPRRLTSVLVLVAGLFVEAFEGASVESINELACSGLLRELCGSFP